MVLRGLSSINVIGSYNGSVIANKLRRLKRLPRERSLCPPFLGAEHLRTEPFANILAPILRPLSYFFVSYVAL
jgi:hypothetical protein